jgi:DNA-binding transcriptional LysR family regulator
MELHEIRYFLAVCETLNFTRAAERCNVTQPALTRAIQKLEAELGGLLFSRERGGTRLTELGRLMQPHLEEVLEGTVSAKDRARRFLRLESAPLTLGVMCTIGPLHFVGLLNRFRVDNPGIELTLTESVPTRLAEGLLAGDLDVAIMASPGGFGERLRSEPLYAERFVIACSVGHRFARTNGIALRELDGETYLNRINCEFRDLLRERCEDCGARLMRAHRSEREDWIQSMVAAGMGICFIPEFSVTVPGVVTRPVREPETVRTVSLVTVAGRRWSPPLARFVQTVHAYRWPEAQAAAEAEEAEA